MDPGSTSVCRLHPGVAVTGFCPACLRDRLASLQPPSAADLRRCKSFSYARSSAIYQSHQQQPEEPQRRSCDLFRQQQRPVDIAVPEKLYHRRMEEEPSRKSTSSFGFGSLLGKKLQQWRGRKKQEPPVPEEKQRPVPGRQYRQHSFRDVGGRRSSCCDHLQVDPVSWDARHQLPPAMLSTLSVEEDYVDMPVPRSDGRIPVELEEDYYYDDDKFNNNVVLPGGCVQTRDYYLDSSSCSSRRRRSVDSNSLSDVNNCSELPTSMMMATNANGARPVSPPDFHHAHPGVQIVHGQYHHRSCSDKYWDQPTNNFSGSFGAANKQHNKKGIKGWSIWGLIHKKSSSRKPDEAGHGSSSSTAEPAGAGAGAGEEYPWRPELRARGYDGQMLRCNSSVSARSSFSACGSARRSISSAGAEIQHDNDAHHAGSASAAGRMRRRDEVLQLERNRLTSSMRSSSASYSRSAGHDHHPPVMGGAGTNYQFITGRPIINHNGVVVRSSNKISKPTSSACALPRRSTLGPNSTDPIPSWH